MAVRKLPSGNWKPLVRGTDGKWLKLGAYSSKSEALAAEQKAIQEVKSGSKLTSENAFQTVLDYFEVWVTGGTSKASAGWKKDHVRNYEKYIHPVIGSKALYKVKPADIANVLARAEVMGRAPQTRRHIYNLMSKMFKDAVDCYDFIGKSPVKRDFKPTVPKKEAIYLTVDEVVALLLHSLEKPIHYQVSIWLQLYIGLRVGEVQSLRCKDVDLVDGKIWVRSTFVRKERRIQDHPKGKEWHSVKMPPELQSLIATVMQGRQDDDYVASLDGKKMLSYEYYLKMLKRYCEECGVTKVATHGLRHSTSEIYVAHGATRDDIYKLFKHSSISVTERYMHDKGENVQKIAQVIRLFPVSNPCSSKSPDHLAGLSSDVARNVARDEQSTDQLASKEKISG